MKLKESRWMANNTRLKDRIEALEQEKSELKAELQIMEKQRIVESLIHSKSTAVNNSRQQHNADNNNTMPTSNNHNHNSRNNNNNTSNSDTDYPERPHSRPLGNHYQPQQQQQYQPQQMLFLASDSVGHQPASQTKKDLQPLTSSLQLHQQLQRTSHSYNSNSKQTSEKSSVSPSASSTSSRLSSSASNGSTDSLALNSNLLSRSDSQHTHSHQQHSGGHASSLSNPYAYHHNLHSVHAQPPAAPISMKPVLVQSSSSSSSTLSLPVSQRLQRPQNDNDLLMALDKPAYTTLNSYDNNNSNSNSKNINNNFSAAKTVKFKLSDDRTIKTGDDVTIPARQQQQQQHHTPNMAVGELSHNESSSLSSSSSTNMRNSDDHQTDYGGLKHVEKLLENGTILTIFDNGTLKELSADKKLTLVKFFNGDRKEINHETGTETYYYAETKIMEIIYANGLKITQFPNGQVEKQHINNTREIIFPDKISKFIFQDGSEESRLPNGTVLKVDPEGNKTIEYPNKQREIHTKEFKKREYPDGSVKTVYVNGISETKYANGRVRIKDKDGNVISDQRH